SQRILSPISRTTPSLTKHNKPIFSGTVSRQSQLHSGRFKMRSRHFHVIRATESYPLGPLNGPSSGHFQIWQTSRSASRFLLRQPLRPAFHQRHLHHHFLGLFLSAR